MNSRSKLIYESGLKNKAFLLDIYEADQDQPPGRFDSELKKHCFLIIYYGWLVGKYGKDWKKFL